MASPFPDLDPESITAFFDGDDALVRELAEVFLAEAPGQLAVIVQAVADADGPGITRGAHTFKGSTGALGLDGLHAVAERLEDAARTGDLASTQQMSRELEDAWPAVERVLRTLAAE